MSSTIAPSFLSLQSFRATRDTLRQGVFRPFFIFSFEPARLSPLDSGYVCNADAFESNVEVSLDTGILKIPLKIE